MNKARKSQKMLSTSIYTSSRASASEPVQGTEDNSHLLQEFRAYKHQRRNLIGGILESAFDSIKANRTRSLLTVLGITIGVAAVIGVLLLMGGVSAYNEQIILSDGANTISIFPAVSRSTAIASQQAYQSLNARDLQPLRRLPHIIALSPFIMQEAQVVYGNQQKTIMVSGVASDFQNIGNRQLAEGLWFSSTDETSGKLAVVLGNTIAHHLFSTAGIDPIGQMIRINNQTFRVVGVLSSLGADQDDAVYIPYTTAQVRLTNQVFFNRIYMVVDDANSINQVVQGITTTLEGNHHIPEGHANDFEISTSIQQLQQLKQALQAYTTLLVSSAIITLTIGGIGIMNIMLTSVTERTSEIGVRLSLGARRRDILLQFLLEAVLQCMCSGILGVMLGIFLGWSAVTALGAAATEAGNALPLVVTPMIIFPPLGISLGVGIIFGLYPAIRAAHLDPIEALHQRT